ncbi:hypothetical protein MRX96_033982 [Rhipicephalus microplus]
MRQHSTTTQIRLPFRFSWLRRWNAYRHPTSDALAIMGFCIERDTVKSANYKGAATIAGAMCARWLFPTLSSNSLVFGVQMITATLYHVLLPPVQTVCTVAPMEHAPSFYH